MIYAISSLSGHTALGFPASGFTSLLAPPFDDGNDLQCNATCKDLCLPCSPTLGNENRALDADLNTSSSAFSIRDWIVNPSSSPAPSDALCGSSTVPHQFESVPDASPIPPGTPAGLNLLSVALAAPGSFTVGIDPAILAASPSTNADCSNATVKSVLLQTVERICFGRVPITTCLSPSQTLIPASSHVSELPSMQPPPDLMPAGSGYDRNVGNLFATPIGDSRELASNRITAVGTALMSPRSTVPPNGCAKGLIVSPDTPVFNVHEGISEYDLQRRANRYRRRYPGRSLDRPWAFKVRG
jgi:hypothetical protein